jgi:hypothetical protein
MGGSSASIVALSAAPIDTVDDVIDLYLGAGALRWATVRLTR